MKKWLSLGVCVLLLLSLTACGKTPVVEDSDYRYGMEQLELGNLAKAYGYFKVSADPRAAEQLEKFVFVPTVITRKSSLGRDLVHTYTYDERGNLLSYTNKGDQSWTMKSDSETTYTYDDHNRKLTETQRFQDETSRETYTYDEKGNELTYVYFNYSGAEQSGYTNTYDERGNLVKAEHYDRIDAACNFTEEFIYDEQDRLLTRTVTYRGEEPTVHTYVHEEDGTYYYWREGNVGDVNFISTSWYDAEDRTVKYEWRNKDTDEIEECYEYRYDERGNQVYRRYFSYGEESVTTITYNEQGEMLTSETVADGETTSITVYTYNEAGDPLTYEYASGSTWNRVIYTYDENGHLLTEKGTGSYGWRNFTYTYDEAGRLVQVEGDGVDTNYVCAFTYDAYGNILTCNFTEEDNYDGLTVMQNEAQWELRYYPDGYSDEVRFAIGDANIWMDPT